MRQLGGSIAAFGLQSFQLQEGSRHAPCAQKRAHTPLAMRCGILALLLGAAIVSSGIFFLFFSYKSYKTQENIKNTIFIMVPRAGIVFNLSYHSKETLLSTIDIHYGDLNL